MAARKLLSVAFIEVLTQYCIVAWIPREIFRQEGSITVQLEFPKDEQEKAIPSNYFFSNVQHTKEPYKAYQQKIDLSICTGGNYPSI